jgi:hypothetical protein
MIAQELAWAQRRVISGHFSAKCRVCYATNRRSRGRSGNDGRSAVGARAERRPVMAKLSLECLTLNVADLQQWQAFYTRLPGLAVGAQ